MNEAKRRVFVDKGSLVISELKSKGVWVEVARMPADGNYVEVVGGQASMESFMKDPDQPRSLSDF